MRRGNFGEKGRPLQSIGTFCCELCRSGWTGRFAVWVCGLGWAERSTSSIVLARWHQCAQFQSYSPGGANVPDDILPWAVHKEAEPIDMPFGLRTPIVQRKQKFNCICQVAPMCTISIIFAGRCQYTRRHSAESCAKTAEPIDLPFGLWTQVGGRKHKFNRIRQVAPTCPHGRAHWHHLANTIVFV